jgi:hypothetical protein
LNADVIDLTLPNPVEHEIINLNDDLFNIDATETINLSDDSFNVNDHQDEVIGNVLEWISGNICKKVRYKAIRQFQEM